MNLFTPVIGQTKTVTDASNNVTSFKYDLAGRQEYVVDALTRTNFFEYDGAGRNIKTIYANGTYTTNGFNSLGQRTVTRDQGGLLTQFAYDVSGQLTNVAKPQVPDPEAGYALKSPAWGYQYDQYGRLTVTVDPKGRGTTNAYDALGREVKRSLALGYTATNVYYTNTAARGQLWESYDFLGQRTRYVYDNFGRAKAKFRFGAGSNAPSDAVCYLYNPMGQLAQITERYGADASTNACDGYTAFYPNSKFKIQNEKWEARAFAWAQREVPTEAGGAWAGAVVLALLAFGVRGVRCQVRELAVNGWERFQFEVSSFKGRERSTFNIQRSTSIAALCALCVLLRQMVFSQQPALPRRLRLPGLFWRTVSVVTLAALIYSDPNVQRLTTAQAACNDLPGNASTLTTRITNFSYDLEGRLEQVNAPEGVINYEYDLATGRHTRTCTAHSEAGYGYDDLGRLSSVTVFKRNGTTLTLPEVTSYTYTAVGSRATVTLPNQTVTTYRYDSLNRLTNLTHVSSNSVLLASYSYQMQETGRRTNAVEILKQEDGPYQTNTLRWAYDGLYRLTNEVSVSTAGGSFTNGYQYDVAGNRLKKTRQVGSQTETILSYYNANDQLLREEITPLSGSLTTNYYAYDANGSVTGRTNASGTVAYTYTAGNKLSGVTTVGSGVTNYFQYSDSGIRVRSWLSSGGDPTLYLVDGNNHTGYAQVLEERSTLNSQPTRSYVIGDDVLAQASSTATYLLYDGHGSTRQLLSSAGTVSSRYNYDAYGTTLGTSSTTAENAATSLLYCGEQYDSSLGMYNLRARFYDPSNGRFNQRDSYAGDNFDPQSLHKYGYCHDDPVNGIDPSGCWSYAEVGISMLIGAVVSGLISAAINRDKSGAEFWKAVGFDALVGGITAPIGGAALRIAGKAFAPLLKRMFEPLLKIVGNWGRITLTGGKSAIEKLLVKMSRHVLNTNRNYPGVDKTLVGGFLKKWMPSLDWEMHHIWIKQAWSRLGPNQIYDDVLANEGLRRFGNGFWNLIPMPNALHVFITGNPIAAPLFASTVYVLMANAHEHWGIIDFMDDVFDENGGSSGNPEL